MIVYAESSAVLTWLLGEKGEAAVRNAMSSADRIVASTLTSLECARALIRGVETKRLKTKDELAALALLQRVSQSWVTLEMAGRVLDRARARFPHEPVRTMDALHLATAAMCYEAFGELTMLSLDTRVRENATALGFRLVP